MDVTRAPLCRRSLALCLLFIALYTCPSFAECGPYPIGTRLGNVSLTNGQTARGVAYSVGSPEQEFAFLPQWPLNNVMAYGTNGKCTPPSPADESGCTTWRGGQYDSLSSSTRRGITQDSYPKDADNYPSMNFYSDELKLNDNVTMSRVPIGVPLEDWGQEGYHPMMAVGLGTNSSILNMLKADGSILSRTWSMFHGWTGASSTSQHDGTFVFGGYDRAKVSGRGYKMSLTKDEGCASEMMITVGDMILNFPNGTTKSLFTSESKSFSACLVPDYPVIMTIPQDPYFERFQEITQTTISERTAGLSYYSVLYDDGDDPYEGDLTIEIQSGPSIRIPNHQLVTPQKYIDEDTRGWAANASKPNLLLNPIQDVNANDLPKLGRYFLSSAYVMLNQDAGEFTLWSSNPTDVEDLVAIDEKGDELTEFCNPTPTPSPSSDPSSSPTGELVGGESTGGEDPGEESTMSTGTIVGIAVGGAAGLGAIVAAVVILWRRRRRNKTRDVLNRDETGPSSHNAVMIEDPYAKNNYYHAELPGGTPSPLDHGKSVHPSHYELAG
ncbi:aspartic peptidase domain-containing protein [Emericellopsis atlantica]|uniref:Aspartic peptidase domain-containing protein n=1 Tax=Emericellopsis atlantica TaxID=2614577 RepID=A0A9P7ZM15_9HYPO|nr:aspartic peptidase domain-containing protein [Emericellopsis atlantica]KAG9254075.1 aspartic peptidase domain-containing protein [Emericellopsis atlantica]